MVEHALVMEEHEVVTIEYDLVMEEHDVVMIEYELVLDRIGRRER